MHTQSPTNTNRHTHTQPCFSHTQQGACFYFPSLTGDGEAAGIMGKWKTMHSPRPPSPPLPPHTHTHTHKHWAFLGIDNSILPLMSLLIETNGSRPMGTWVLSDWVAVRRCIDWGLSRATGGGPKHTRLTCRPYKVNNHSKVICRVSCLYALWPDAWHDPFICTAITRWGRWAEVEEASMPTHNVHIHCLYIVQNIFMFCHLFLFCIVFSESTVSYSGGQDGSQAHCGRMCWPAQQDTQTDNVLGCYNV